MSLPVGGKVRHCGDSGVSDISSTFGPRQRLQTVNAPDVSVGGLAGSVGQLIRVFGIQILNGTHISLCKGFCPPSSTSYDKAQRSSKMMIK